MNKARKLNLLYVGDALSQHGFTPTSVETLAPLLSEFYNVKTVSNKKNQVIRLLDMVLGVVKNKKNIDLIMIDTYSTKSFYYAFLVSQLARLFKINYYTCLRGGNLPNRLERSPFLSGMIFNNASMNIAPSKYLENTFIKLNYKVTFITNNINLSLYEEKIRKDLKPHILYVRAFSNIYNPQMAINAFQMFKKEFTEATMCMVGPDKDGTQKLCIELARNLGLEDDISFPGTLSKEKWRALSKNYDIFINPTNFDNQPVSVMEAMALGFPIVTTNVGGLPFLVEDGKDGLLIEPNDAKLMYEGMCKLMNNPDLAELLSVNARKKANDFDWRTVQKEWINILK